MSAALDVNAMLVFASVVEQQSFSAAAIRLNQSKSAVSKQISRLEDAVGARLLQRTTRRLALTDAGAAFYERCARVAAEVEDAQRTVSHLQSEPRGRMRISGPLSFGIRYLGPVIADFLSKYPHVEVDLDLSDRRVDLLAEGFDLAIRIGQLADSSLIARRLCPVSMYLVASPEYLRRRGQPAHPRELVGHNCLQYSYTPSDIWVIGTASGPVTVHTRGDLRTNNGDVVLAAVRAGLGIAILPGFICGPDLHSGEIVEVFADCLGSGPVLSAVYPHARYLTPKVRLLVDRLVSAFEQPPWARRCI